MSQTEKFAVDHKTSVERTLHNSEYLTIVHSGTMSVQDKNSLQLKLKPRLVVLCPTRLLVFKADVKIDCS